MNIGEGIICTQGLTSHQRRTITRLYREQILMKLARGVYYPATGYPDLSSRSRYSLHCLAYGIEGRTLVGRSAACLHDLPILYDGNSSVEAIGHTKRSGVIQRDLPPIEITEIKVAGYRVKVTSPAMTTIDLARWRSLGESVRVGDEVLAKGRATLTDLERCLELRKHGPGTPVAREALGLINGLSESPRESEVKVALYQNGYPQPVQQAVIKRYPGGFHWPGGFLLPRSLNCAGIRWSWENLWAPRESVQGVHQ